MHRNNKNIQAVFLVDVNQTTSTVNNETEAQEKAIRVSLSTFRLLTRLSTEMPVISNSKKPISKCSLKWGYKFFNSMSHNSKIEQYDLKDFKLRYFEEFENEVERRFEENAKRRASTKSRYPQSPFKCDPSNCLMKALTEILYDFHWEMPDLMSPVKGLRKGKSTTAQTSNLANLQRNYVFLISSCPKTPANLRKFAGKKVIDDSVLIESFMPQSLYNKFCNNNGLRLFWIDTDFYSDEICKESVCLVEKGLFQLGGKLLPLQALVCAEQRLCNAKGDSLKEKCTEKEKDMLENVLPSSDNESILADIFPYTCIIDYLLEVKEISSESFQQDSIDGILRNRNGDIFCKLEVKPPIKGTSLSSVSHINSTTSVLMSELSGSGSSKQQILKIHKDESLDSCSNKQVNFHMHSSIKNNIGCRFKTGSEYICTGTLYSDGGNKIEISVAFQKLLQKLMYSQSSLILKAENCPALVLMSPLNKMSATIRVLAIGASLKIEKSIHMKAVTSCKTEEENSPILTLESIDLQKMKCAVQKSSSRCHLIHKKQEMSKAYRGRLYDPQCIDKTHLPGCQSAMPNLIEKLNERISQLDFLSEDEVKTLRWLQKTYRIQNQPLKPREPPSTTIQKTKSTESEIEAAIEEPVFLKQDSKKGRGSMPSRGEMMVTRSRQSVHLVKEDDMEKTITKKTDVKTNPRNVEIQSDFRDESELSNYLREMYDQTLSSEDSGLIMCAQTVVLVALHYMKETGKDSPEDALSEFLKHCIIIDPAKLREKHQCMDSDGQKSDKIREYQLQIILRMECLSIRQGADQSLSNDDSRIEEIVTMLRTLSFLAEPTFLPDFLAKTLVDSYIHTLPQTLGSIYDELMQPLPALLESILSPDRSMNQSVLGQSVVSNEGDTTTDNVSASQFDLIEPSSNKSDILLSRPQRKSRGRPLVHHPSLADMGPKRQIVVQNKIVKNDKKGKSNKKGNVHSQKKKMKDNGQEKVCRNLFAGEKKKLERRQSVAVMERVKRTPKKSKGFSVLKSPKALKSPFKSPGYSKKKMVSETPAHKQQSHAVWNRLEKERRRTMSVTNINLVEESPMKTGMKKRDSPSQNKRALALVRRSFYSAGPTSRSRNLTKSFQLADRIAGRQRHSSGQRRLGNLNQSLVQQFKSPDKNSSFLLSQLMGSPTPPKSTPKKNLGTPLKVAESPSMNTRSRSPGFCLRSKIESQDVKLCIDHHANSREDLRKVNSPVSLKKLTCTPTKNESPVPKDLFLSPSQNTRSKVMSTPTRSSVRTILFLKSPEPKSVSGSLQENNSVVKYHERKNSPAVKNKKSSNVKAISGTESSLESTISSPSKDHSGFINCSWIEPDGSVKSVSVRSRNAGEISKTVAICSSEKTPSPRKSTRSGMDIMSPNSQNISPSGQMQVKTPTSLNHWPRKKHIRMGSPKSSEIKMAENRGIDSDKQHEQRNCSSLTLPENVEKRFKLETQGENITKIEGKSESQVLTMIGSVNSESLCKSPRISRKRSLAISPDNLSFSSPSKRKRSHVRHLADRKDSLPISYCLHSRIVSHQSSIFSDTESILSSQGFETSQLPSSQSSINSQSASQIESLSQKSACSDDYFSVSNDEVFLSQPFEHQPSNVLLNSIKNVTSSSINNIRNQSSARSESPVFGSGRKLKRHPTSQFTVGLEVDNDVDMVDISESECDSVDTQKHENLNQPSKVSPSGRKYSPNVSAKSLMHLISSPLLKSPVCGGENVSDSNSPRIDQDSLNIRRKRMQGKSRRSLKLQN